MFEPISLLGSQNFGKLMFGWIFLESHISSNALPSFLLLSYLRISRKKKDSYNHKIKKLRTKARKEKKERKKDTLSLF
jgi:hypothetical protein